MAGEIGGLPLVAPRGERTRPTAGRVKEALFAALGPQRLEGASVLDGYAGSGALAIEALSRGARHAMLVDRDASAVEAIRRNLRSTGLKDRARVQRRTLSAFLRDRPPHEAPFDLVLLDPPYDLATNELSTVLDELASPGWLARGAVVVLEQASVAAPPPLPAGWEARWERVYGDTLVRILGP
ncbi:MAG: 16S rRNA (guanine(966)-N(2))-methyltransferase RsmD [Actinobacteria bacterium]|nr:16S rRNA (guanine(966)-N(2))-methyltransferase RsmD [Actinomycetota bacterium]